MSNPRSSYGAKTLPAKYFVSDEIYRLETERVFETHWQCVGQSSAVREVGQSLLVQIAGESIIVVRTEEGTLRAFFNVCRHRGTQLCETSGQKFRKSITCPYHAWSYDLNGDCTAAPNMSDLAGFAKSEYSLKQAAVAERHGFVFVSLAPNPPSVTEALGPLDARLADWNTAELIAAARLEYTVAANWKMLFQNYNECYHCPRVHPALNAMSSYDTASNDIDAGPVLGGPMRLSDGVGSMTTTGEACAAVLPSLNEDDQRRVYYFTVFPTMFISPHPDFVLVHRLERLSPSSTEIVCEFLFHHDEVARRNFDPTPAVEFWDETNKQDWHVCELSQKGVNSRAYEPGPYSNLECTLAAFDRHYLETMNVR